MPFDTPPGQVLSSVPSTSDRRRSSKLAGCAGVLFQIFHGKRLFPRKSLPAERPKQVASNHTDDKLPIAKLLLIADENSSGPLKDTDEEVEVPNVVKVRVCEEEAPRRTPGVVARLMGLETMPHPESVSGERKKSEPNKDVDFQLYTDTPQQDRCNTTEAPVQPVTSVRKVRTREFKTDLPAKFAARQRVKVHDDIAKLKVLAKSPSLSPHHFDAAFPSVVASKGETFNRNSTRTRKAAHLIESAPKTLQQNSIQPNCQTRSEQLQTSTLRNNTGSLNAVTHYRGQSGRERMLVSNEQLVNSAVQASGNKHNEIKVAQVAPRYTSHDPASRRHISDLQRPQLASSKRSPPEATLVKRKHGYQGAFGEAKANMSEKVKPDWRQQQETSKRLSQPTNCSAIKTQRTRPARHPSPPKSVQDSSGSVSSSQASNCVPSSSVGTLASRVIKSHIGSNNVSAEELSSSSVQGSLGKPEEVDEIMDARQPLLCGNINILQNPDPSQSFEPENSFCSQYSQDGSSSSAIYTESLQRSSMESSISSDPSLSELTTSSEECANFLVEENITGCERGEKKQKDFHHQLHDIKRTSDSFLMESSSQSLTDSLTVSLGDTASSQGHTNAKGFGSAHTYSGRNTAAILQELLTALSSSTSQRKSTEHFDIKSEGTESCSSGSSDFRQVERLQDLSAGHERYGEDLCMESTLQDTTSSNSIDTFQDSQGNEEGEKDDFNTSNDSPSMAEMRSEDEHLPETARTGRTQMQPGPTREHADFADCEALMSAISKLHHIDPEAIGLNVRAAKHDNEGKVILNVAPEDGLFKCLLDSDFSDKPDDEQTQQFNLGLSSSTTLTLEDDADSIYRSDIESSFRIGYDEAAAWNKKLVTDCINEAFKSLSKQLYTFSSSIYEHSSATHVLSRVYKQLDEWKAMATNMNLDDMIEKEMNSTTRSWRNIGIETEEVAEVLQGSILSGLLEEMLLELI